MGLALCHIVPRDLLLRLVIFCLVSAFVLNIAAVAIANDSGSLASIDGGGAKLSITGRAIQGNAVLCSKDKRAGSCDAFVAAAIITHDLAIVSLCVLAFALALVCCFVTPCAKTTTQMVIALWLITLLPVAFLSSCVGYGIGRAVDKATTSGQSFTVGDGMALLITALALSIATVILATIRTVMLCARAGEKADVLRQRDINGVMQLHSVNDDWTRQKQVLAAHAITVQAEIKEQVAREPLGDAAEEAPAHNTPHHHGDSEAPPVFVHHRTPSTMHASSHA